MRHPLSLLVAGLLMAGSLTGCALVQGRSAAPGEVVQAREATESAGDRVSVLVPVGRVEVVVGAPLDELGEDDTADLQERRAPEGGTWLPIAWELDDAGLPSYADLMATAPEPVVVRVRSGGATYELTDDLGSSSTPVHLAVDGDGSEVSLEVEYDGVTQVIAVSSGDRDAGAAAALYSLPDQLPPAPACPRRGWIRDASVRGSVDCRLAPPIALPYLPEQGWAETGRTWLVLQTEVTLTDVTRRSRGNRGAVTVRSAADATSVAGAGPVGPLGGEGEGSGTTFTAVYDAPLAALVDVEVGRDYRVESARGGEFTVALRRSVDLRL